MGINCGSLEKKRHQLYCYLILGMPDIVCPQETWALMPEGWLNELPYQHVAPDPYKGGGGPGYPGAHEKALEKQMEDRCPKALPLRPH